MKTKKIKKISYLSSLILVVASTIGAGIFFKNRELSSMSHGNVALVLSTWIIAFIGIFALGIALIELSSIKIENKGILGWTKQFCPKWFHQATINYQKYFFIPITMFALSLYVVSTFVDAGWKIHNGWLVLLISFGVFIIFMLINLLSLKWAEKVQWITTFLQMIPLFVLPILALIGFAKEGYEQTFEDNVVTNQGFLGLSSWLVLLGGLPAIFFAYDGFYTVIELKDDLQEPKKLGKSLCFGLILISVIYLFLAIAFNLGSIDGTHNGIKNLSPRWKSFFNCLIAFGIMGIINGYALASPKLYQNMLIEQNGKDLIWLHKFLFKHRKALFKHQKNISLQSQTFITSWFYLLISTTLFFISFGVLGMALPLGNWGIELYGTGGQLYELADLVLNYSSLLIFVIIVSAILGYLLKRKEYLKNNQIKQLKLFKFFSWLAVFLFYFSLGFVLITSIINATGFNNASIYKELLKLSIFLGVIFISVGLGLYQVKKNYRLSNFEVLQHNQNQS